MDKAAKVLLTFNPTAAEGLDSSLVSAAVLLEEEAAADSGTRLTPPKANGASPTVVEFVQFAGSFASFEKVISMQL